MTLEKLIHKLLKDEDVFGLSAEEKVVKVADLLIGLEELGGAPTAEECKTALIGHEIGRQRTPRDMKVNGKEPVRLIKRPHKTYKLCTNCKFYKSTDNFRVLKAQPDGLQYYCKPCALIYSNFKDEVRDQMGYKKCKGCLRGYPTNDEFWIKQGDKLYLERCKSCFKGKDWDKIT